MLLSEIKDYLQIFHLELRDDILQDLKEKKQLAVNSRDELLANEIWCLIEVYNIQKNYLKMFQRLKEGKYEEAWLIMDKIDISMGNLRNNFEEGMSRYNLTFINTIIKYYEKVFPDYVYTSRESIIKSEKCSICGAKEGYRPPCHYSHNGDNKGRSYGIAGNGNENLIPVCQPSAVCHRGKTHLQHNKSGASMWRYYF